MKLKEDVFNSKRKMAISHVFKQLILQLNLKFNSRFESSDIQEALMKAKGSLILPARWGRMLAPLLWSQQPSLGLIPLQEEMQPLQPSGNTWSLRWSCPSHISQGPGQLGE
jgi:hypothetical protein